MSIRYDNAPFYVDPVGHGADKVYRIVDSVGGITPATVHEVTLWRMLRPEQRVAMMNRTNVELNKLRDEADAKAKAAEAKKERRRK